MSLTVEQTKTRNKELIDEVLKAYPEKTVKKRAKHLGIACAIPQIRRNGALSPEPVLHEVVLIWKPIMRIRCPFRDDHTIELAQQFDVLVAGQDKLNRRAILQLGIKWKLHPLSPSQPLQSLDQRTVRRRKIKPC